ncbi:MAG: zf-HC2 domain-containing protein [Deltaproteobacteria bacterium]|nr:zf-HC2 domain-containing protein [Deltaproteobacteria bacterium]
MSNCKSPNATNLGCRQVVDYALDYLDGALPTAESSHFREHLDACPECVAFFETYRRTPEVSRECFAVKMPERVKAAVMSFLRSRCGS